MFTGIMQRLLAFLALQAVNQDRQSGSHDALKRFHYHFHDYEALKMLKAQFLDRDHLLLRFGNPDAQAFASPAMSQTRNLEVQATARYVGVFNARAGKFVCFLPNASHDIVRLYERFTDHFRVGSDCETWGRYVCSYANEQHLRSQLDRQRGKYRMIRGGELDLMQQISTLLPLSPQTLSPTPYLDSRLFQFDERFVNGHPWPRPIPDHPVKFLARGPSHPSTRFKIDPAGEAEDQEEVYKDDYASYIFHPYLPFAISMLHSPGVLVPKAVKFHFR